jgi:hypothetical protein
MRIQILIIEGANFKIGALGILRIQHSNGNSYGEDLESTLWA